MKEANTCHQLLYYGRAVTLRFQNSESDEERLLAGHPQETGDFL